MEGLAFERSWTAVTIYIPDGCNDCALIRRPNRQSPRYYHHISKATRNRLIYLFACSGNRVMPVPFPLPEGQLSYYWLRKEAIDYSILDAKIGTAPYPTRRTKEKVGSAAPSSLFSSWMKALSGRVNS